MSVKSLAIGGFTVFEEELKLGFSPNMNVFIGENGTGKTQILKVLYSFCETYDDIPKINIKDDYIRDPDIIPQFPSGTYIFNKVKSILAECLQVSEVQFDKADIDYENMDVDLNISRLGYFQDPHKKSSAIFIPSKDMLTHSKGLLAMAKLCSKSMPFDKTILDIIDRATRWHLDEVEPWIRCILTKLEKIIGGTVFERDGEFFVLKEDGKEISFAFEAEGVKKFGLLWLLLINGSINKNTILLWDEPEANINPKLIPILVEVLLELARHGVQIFIATHDYYFPQYVEVLAKESDSVKFHSLHKTKNGVKCETSDKFSMLENEINDEAIRLYDAEVEKVMK